MSRLITLFVLLWLSVTVAALQRPATATPGVSVWGTVRDASGKPVDGAVVSIRGVDQTFSTSVFTDEKGEYVSPPLPARRYRMWAQATGFATGRAELALGTRPASQAFTLPVLEDVTPQLTGDEWLDSLPVATPEDRRMKQILRVVCTDCHSLAVVMVNRFDENGWRLLTRAMGQSGHNGWIGKPANVFGQILRYHADELATYLARVRGPEPSTLKLKPRPRPRGAAAAAVITEYDVPIGERPTELAWFDGSDWSQGPAVGMHGIVGVHDVMADRDGNAWIFESRASFETHRTFMKLDTRTGHTTAFAALQKSSVVSSEQIEMDRDGNVWAQHGGGLRWDPRTEMLTVFPTPAGFPPFFNSMDTDSAGRVWFNGLGGSARLDPTSKQWQMFKQTTPYDGFSYGMAVDADDNGWWSAWNGDAVFKADVKTGTITEILMRDPEYNVRKALATQGDLEFFQKIGTLRAEKGGGLSANPAHYANAPRRMSADSTGTRVWVPNWAGGNIAEIDIRTNKVTYHKLPVSGNPYKTDVDAQHNMWATVPNADALVMYDPSTRKWTVYPYTSHGCGPRHVSVDQQRGEVWVPCDQSSKVARFQFRTTQQIRAQKRAAQAGSR